MARISSISARSGKGVICDGCGRDTGSKVGKFSFVVEFEFIYFFLCPFFRSVSGFKIIESIAPKLLFQSSKVSPEISV